MKQIELERTLEKLKDEIIESKLISKCKEIIDVVGEEQEITTSEIKESYIFEWNNLSIIYRIYGVDEEEKKPVLEDEILISYDKNNVFHARQRENKKYIHPNIGLFIGNDLYEVSAYQRGDWIDDFEILYKKATTEVQNQMVEKADRQFKILKL